MLRVGTRDAIYGLAPKTRENMTLSLTPLPLTDLKTAAGGANTTEGKFNIGVG